MTIKGRFQKVVEEVSELPKDKQDFSKSISDLNIDSLELVEIVYAMEEEFDISLPDEEIWKCENLNDLLNLVEIKL